MYAQTHQFEPLMPADAQMEPLLAKAHDLSRIATLLAGKHAPPELHSLLRSMNSYYTNRIEGQRTRPREIDQALRKDFSKATKLAAMQRLAVAHIEAEVALEQRYEGVDQGESITPGQLRQRQVRVGEHVGPAFASVPEFLQRWGSYYGSVCRGEAALVAMACAHQRLGWVHPFVDGNRRVMVAVARVCPQHRAVLRTAGRCRQPAP